MSDVENKWTICDGISEININREFQNILLMSWEPSEYGTEDNFENRVRVMAIAVALSLYNKNIPNAGQALSDMTTLNKLYRGFSNSKKLSVKYTMCRLADLEGTVMYPLLQCMIHVRNCNALVQCIEGMVMLCKASIEYNSPDRVAKRTADEKDKLKELSPKIQLEICKFIGRKGLHWYKTLSKIHGKVNPILKVDNKRRGIKEYNAFAYDLLLIHYYLRPMPELKEVSDMTLYTGIPELVNGILETSTDADTGIGKALDNTIVDKDTDVFKFGTAILA